MWMRPMLEYKHVPDACINNVQIIEDFLKNVSQPMKTHIVCRKCIIEKYGTCKAL